MRYNFDENRPALYEPRQYSQKVLDDIQEQIEDYYPSLIPDFERVGYNPYDYIYKHIYLQIADEKERIGIISLLLEYAPVRDYFEKWNSVIADFPAWDLSKNDVTSALCYLFFCEKEEDIWRFFSHYNGNYKELFTFYEDCLSSQKVRDFLIFLYRFSDSLKDDILPMLESEFDFNQFDDENVETIWVTGIPELQKKVVDEWIKWAGLPSERRIGYGNILPEIVDYLKEHPEDFFESPSPMEGCPYIAVPSPSPETWKGLSETLIDQALENSFGEKYKSLSDIPTDDLLRLASGIIGPDVATRFSMYLQDVKSKH